MVLGFPLVVYCLRCSWRLFCGDLEQHLENFPHTLSQGPDTTTGKRIGGAKQVNGLYLLGAPTSPKVLQAWTSLVPTCLSGGTVDAMGELDPSSTEESGFIDNLKRWFLSHAQYLNFFTILVLASVPNPLFDLAGIMCGQFGIPFWEFFLATLIGKAIIKTHIQTVFIISVCNNQLLHWIENELIWVLSFIPGFESILPNVVTKLHSLKDKYLAAKTPVPSNIKVSKWDFSFASIWNTVVWFMLMNFFVKIVNSTAQRYMKKEQDKHISAFKNKSSISEHSNDSDQ